MASEVFFLLLFIFNGANLSQDTFFPIPFHCNEKEPCLFRWVRGETRAVSGCPFSLSPDMPPLQISPYTSTWEGKCHQCRMPAADPTETAGQGPGAKDLEEVRGGRLLIWASLRMTRVAKRRNRLVMGMAFIDTRKGLQKMSLADRGGPGTSHKDTWGERGWLAG